MICNVLIGSKKRKARARISHDKRHNNNSNNWRFGGNTGIWPLVLPENWKQRGLENERDNLYHRERAGDTGIAQDHDKAGHCATTDKSKVE